jgi:16S rRNA (guanine966-N2)-methyltransferase
MKKRNVGSEPGAKDAVGLRVIGGRFHGSRLQYIGDNRVRPMKDRVREAAFNLIGPTVKGKHVIDLFGGTGALCIEAISRGAVSGTAIELHLPTAALLRKNLEALNLLEIVEWRKTDAFFWARNTSEHPQGVPWIVFCSPPYGFYVERQQEMIELLDNLRRSAPSGSVFVVESDDRFDLSFLPFPAESIRTRSYPPAVIAISE